MVRFFGGWGWEGGARVRDSGGLGVGVQGLGFFLGLAFFGFRGLGLGGLRGLGVGFRGLGCRGLGLRVLDSCRV